MGSAPVRPAEKNAHVCRECTGAEGCTSPADARGVRSEWTARTRWRARQDSTTGERQGGSEERRAGTNDALTTLSAQTQPTTHRTWFAPCQPRLPRSRFLPDSPRRHTPAHTPPPANDGSRQRRAGRVRGTDARNGGVESTQQPESRSARTGEVLRLRAEGIRRILEVASECHLPPGKQTRTHERSYATASFQGGE